MNLQTISDRYTVTAIDAADAPDYALGAPKRVTDVPAAEPERWVPTETRGYQRSTTTGAIRKVPEYASDPATPPWWPCGVLGVEDDGACCVPSAKDIETAWFAACERASASAAWAVGNPIIGHVKRKLFREIGHFNVMHDTPSKLRRAVIEALNNLEA